MGTFLDEAAWASPWRSRSVLERVLLTFGLGFWALLSPTWWSAAGILVLVVVIALAIARVPVRTYLLALTAPALFIVLGVVAVVVQIGSAPGALVVVGPFQITASSLVAAGLIAARAFAVTSAVMLLACTTPMTELLAGLRRIGVPGTLVDIAASMYRMITVLSARTGAIRHAQVARLGYASRQGATRSMGMLFSTVFVSAWDRARRLEAGLEGRGGTAELVALRPGNPVSGRFLGWTIVANLAAVGLMAAGWWWR